MPRIGVLLIAVGVALIVAGALVLLAPKVPLLGRLPGDIHIRQGNFELHFPLATCIVLSLLASLILNFLLRR